ncbi:sodium:calcium antiporter [Histidinibacterium lentulum]|uniref:Sodium:calcium antiporter n=1 Tax=Histidinibacterium lentulum TaxID=2480588 RepID=A0A3N2R8K4_9RHOB|nr:sodium:calcium antiporter [Histidinibacterium lentulum]ROU03765.1 sodium:calcium antiporter [Histidinibacterium lentulum]
MFGALSTPILLGVFAVAALVIVFGGTRMTGQADLIADRTGLGEAIVGGVLLGASTSLSGTIVSVTAAVDGRASLAFSNGIGGIAAQTAFLAIADVVHRRANLEHAAADMANVFQGALLMLMLALPLAAWLGPDVTLLGVHPVSVLLLAIYLGGVYATHLVRQKPMWEAVETTETDTDTPDEEEADAPSTPRLVASFAALMLAMATAGWVVAQVAGELTDRFDIRASVVGALMTAVVTSLPELITTLAAVRRGALQLAMGGIIGGNTFDTLFLVAADGAYREGSLYHAVGRDDLFWITVGLIMTAILTLGQLFRQKEGPGNIGLESVGILVVYAAAILIQTLAGGG